MRTDVGALLNLGMNCDVGALPPRHNSYLKSSNPSRAMGYQTKNRYLDDRGNKLLRNRPIDFFSVDLASSDGAGDDLAAPFAALFEPALV